MENGNLLILSQIPPRGTVEDYCVLVDRNTGEILKTWDHQDVLPQFPVGGSGSQDGHDWDPDPRMDMTGSTTTLYGMTKRQTPYLSPDVTRISLSTVTSKQAN